MGNALGLALGDALAERQDAELCKLSETCKDCAWFACRMGLSCWRHVDVGVADAGPSVSCLSCGGILCRFLLAVVIITVSPAVGPSCQSFQEYDYHYHSDLAA